MQTEYLREVSIFKDLSDAELDAMKDLWALRVIANHDRIVTEGELMHEFFIVGKGIVHVRRMSQDHEVLLARIGSGGFFGEINLFEEATATARVYARGEVHLAGIANAVFRVFLAARPAIGATKSPPASSTRFSGRLRQTNERLVHSMFWSTTQLG